ncbi:MAG TPA: substrate-binding domain-containing protein, partial [Flavisolibacter sp.]|nr:substrate-binding domain-containing protein [Flavisolibacter sp.]
VIVSSPRKQSRVANKQVDRRIPVLLLLQSVSEKKQQWLDAFLAAMQNHATVEVLIANRSLADLQDRLERKANRYRYCIVWLEVAPNALFYQWVRQTQLKEKLVMVQNFEQPDTGDVFAQLCCAEKRGFAAGLKKLTGRLKTYHSVIFLQTNGCETDNELMTCLQEFCAHHQLSFSSCSIRSRGVHPGDVFFCSTEAELVALVKEIDQAGLRMGEDVGLVALFETPLMRFLSNGITTVSADYQTAGEDLVTNILNGKGQTLRVPFRTIFRASL